MIFALGWVCLCLPNSWGARPPALFISTDQLTEVRARSGQAPFASQRNTVIGLADSYLGWSASPFQMTDVRQIRFGWCETAQEPDDTLKDLVEKLTRDSHRIRLLALAGLLSGDERYYVAARAQFLAWVERATLVNLYDLEVNFSNATLAGATSGYCSDRPWNFALDAMWQAYGLINLADAYVILSRNWAGLTLADNEALRGWLRELAAATNSGFHAWTRWADLHPNSSGYTRYRSDNHLGWSLAGLTAAAAALDDPDIWRYVLEGGPWNDGRGGNYANPSHLRDLIDRAIAASGKVYDQDVRAGEHKGFNYACFHLWALSLVAQITEVHRGESFWNQAGTDGGTIARAHAYYAPYVSLQTPIPDASETTDPTFFRFIYEISATKSWSTGAQRTSLLAARNVAARNQLITQSIGPVTLLLGDLGDPEYRLGEVSVTRTPEGSLVVTLPAGAAGSWLEQSTNLTDWTLVPGFDPNAVSSLTISGDNLGGPAVFYRATRE